MARIDKWFILSTCKVNAQDEMEGEFGEFFSLPVLLKEFKKLVKKHKDVHPLQWQVECWRRDNKGILYGGYDDCFKLLDLPSLKPLTQTMRMKRQVKVMEDRYQALQVKALSNGVSPAEQKEAKALAKELGYKVKR